MSLQNFDQETDFIVGESPEAHDVFGVEESAVDNPYVFLANRRARGDSSDSRSRKDSGEMWRIQTQNSPQQALSSQQLQQPGAGLGMDGIGVALAPSIKQELMSGLRNRAPMTVSATPAPFPVVNVQPPPPSGKGMELASAASMNELAFRYLPFLLHRQPSKEAGQRVGKLKILGRGGGVLTQEIEVHWRRELNADKKTFVIHEVIEEFAIRPQSLNVRLIHPAVVQLTSTSATQTVSKARVSLYPHSEYRTWIIEVEPGSGMITVLGVGDVFRTGGIRCEKCSHQASLMRGLEVHVSCPTNEYLNSAFRRFRESNRQQKGTTSTDSEKKNMAHSIANLIALGASCLDPKAVVKTKSRTCARGNPKASSNHVSFATPIGTEEIQKFCHICKTYVDIDHQDGQNHSQLPKRTTTNVTKEGLAVLNVASTTGYVRGQVVEIGTGSQAERRTLQRVIPPKSLQTDRPLDTTHPVGTVVSVVSQPAKEGTKKRQNEFTLWSHLQSQGLVAPPPIPRALLDSTPDDRGLIVLPSEVYDPLVVTANHLTRGSMQQGVRGYLASHLQPQRIDPSRAPFATNPAPLPMSGNGPPVNLWGVGGVDGTSPGMDMDPMTLNRRLMMGQEPHLTLASAISDPSMGTLSPSAALTSSGAGSRSVSGRSSGKRDHDEVSTEHYRDVNELLSETSTSHYPWDRGDFDEKSSNPSAKRVRSTAPPSVASRSVISHSEAALANLSALEINSTANGTDFTSPPHPSAMHVAQDAASGKQFIEDVVRTPEFTTNRVPGSPLLHPPLPGLGDSPVLGPLHTPQVAQTQSLPNNALGLPPPANANTNGHRTVAQNSKRSSRLLDEQPVRARQLAPGSRATGGPGSGPVDPVDQSSNKRLERDSSPMLTRAVMDSLNAEQPHPESSSLIQAQLEQMDHNTLAAPRREDVRYAQGRNSLPIHPRSKYYRYSGREEQAGQLREFLMEPSATKSWSARHVRIIGAPHCGKKSIVAEVVCGPEFAHRDIYWMGRGGQTLQACFEQLEVDTSGLNQKWVNRRRAIIEHLEGLKERPIFIFNGISPEQEHYTPRNADVIHIIPFHLSMSRDVQDLLASRSELAQIARDVERTRDLYTIHISDLTIESALEIFSREFLTHVGIEIEEDNGAATEVVRSLLISDRNRQRDRLSMNRQNSDLSSSATVRNTSSGTLSVNAASPRVPSPLAAQPSTGETDSLSSMTASPGKLEGKERSKNDLDRRVFDNAGDTPAVPHFSTYNDSGVPDLWDSVCELVELTKVHPAIVVLTGTSLGTKVVELKAQRPNAPIHQLVRDPYFIAHVQKTVGKPHKIGGTLFAPLLDALQRFLAESESTQFKPYTRLNVIDVMVFLGDFSMPLPDLIALRGNQNQQDELLEYLRCLDSLSIVRFKHDNSAQIPTVSFHPLYRPLLRRMMKEDAMRYAECLHNTLAVVLEHIDIRRLRENPAKRTPFTQALLNLDHGLAYHTAQWIREQIAEHLRTNTIHPLLSSMIFRCAEFTYRLGWFFRLTKDGKPNEVMWQTATALEFLEHLPVTRERALALAKLVETQGAVISAAGYRDQGAISQHLFLEGDTGLYTAVCSKPYCIGCDDCQKAVLTFQEVLERVRFNSLLAFSLYRSRMFHRALSCAETVIGLIEKLLHDPESCDKSSTDYLDAINDLALCHRLAACVHLSAGRPDKAQMHFKTSVEFHQFAHSHPQFYQIADYTRTMNALAKFWFEREDLDKARECYEQVRQNLLEVDGRLASRVGSAPAYEYAAVGQNLSSLAVEQLFLKWYVRAPNSMNGATLLAWVFEGRRLPVEEGVREVIATAREEWSQALERVPISSGESAALAPVRIDDQSSGAPTTAYGAEPSVGEDGNTNNVFFNDSIVVYAVALGNRAVLETWIAVTYPQLIMPRCAQHRGDIDLVNVSEDCKVRSPNSPKSDQNSCEYEIEQRRKQTLFASLVDIQRAIRLMRGLMTFQGVEVTYLDLALSVCYSSIFISGLSSTLSVKMACDTCTRNNDLVKDTAAVELLFDWLSHPPTTTGSDIAAGSTEAHPALAASGSGVYLLGLAQDALVRSLRRDSKNRHWVSKDNPSFIPSWHRARVLHATGVVGFMRTLCGLFQNRRSDQPKLANPSVSDLFKETLQGIRWSLEMQELLMGDEAGARGKHAPVYSLTRALQREVEATVANQDTLDHEAIARLLLGCQRWLLFPQHLFSKMSAT
eukprot:TRINITY_DN8286_c0_g1_i1.p1 TRINITY_DN8286_c0_g1~~TRINITY_DN8286_c0_g1_i1.p1  ORF type:complete len:2213 (+),score=401.45 TRINITY_DN8286_c0_g1_i1:505-7143(+)